MYIRPWFLWGQRSYACANGRCACGNRSGFAADTDLLIDYVHCIPKQLLVECVTMCTTETSSYMSHFFHFLAGLQKSSSWMFQWYTYSHTQLTLSCFGYTLYIEDQFHTAKAGYPVVMSGSTATACRATQSHNSQPSDTHIHVQQTCWRQEFMLW